MKIEIKSKNNMKANSATKNNKKDMHPRFWYLQMLHKHRDELVHIYALLKKDGADVEDELDKILQGIDSMEKKVLDKFPDPRNKTIE